MDSSKKDAEGKLSEQAILDGFRLAGLASEESMESFRTLKRLSGLSALAHPSHHKVQRHTTSHTPPDTQNG